MHETADAVLGRKRQQLRAHRRRSGCARRVVRPEAMLRVTSDRASPSVLVPRSMPIRRAPRQGPAKASASKTQPGCPVGRHAFAPVRADLCVLLSPWPAYTPPAVRAIVLEEPFAHEDRLVRTLLLPPRDRRQRLLIDPFLKGNPTFEASGIAWDEATKGVTHVALTHGHSDHVGDAGEICSKRGATLFANFELAMFVKSKGAEKLEPMNTGGTVGAADFEITLVNALHSSSRTSTSAIRTA